MLRILLATAAAWLLAAPAVAWEVYESSPSSSSASTGGGDPYCFDNFHPEPGRCPNSNPPSQGSGAGDEAVDVPAPPMALLFGAAVIGLAARRRGRAG